MLYYDRTDTSEEIDINKKVVTIDSFQIKGLIFNCMSAMGVMIY